jgi:hypothetical protein
MLRKFAGSRGFSWHPDVLPDLQKLKLLDRRLWGMLAQLIRSLVAPGGERWGWSWPGEGRIMVSSIVESPGFFLLYVNRRDTNGIAALVVHRDDSGGSGSTVADTDLYAMPPEGAFELARARLMEYPTW